MGDTNFHSALKDVPWLNPANDQAVLIGYMGSISHGTYVPKDDSNSIDDKDVMAIVIPPIRFYFGTGEIRGQGRNGQLGWGWGSRGTKELKRDEWDCVGYELRKYVSLLVKGNPNVLGLLWLDEVCYIHRSVAGNRLITNRSLFASRQAYHSFAGYAHGQLHRMTHGAFEGYMGEKRRALVEKYGYDCKNAAHLIRLLRMAIEFLTEGELYVRRQDATQLIEIKKGEWTLEKIKEEADRLFKLAEEAYVRSKLPNSPDMEKVNDLLTGILMDHFRGHYLLEEMRKKYP
jgi:predicted nucleotidyltransferase